MSKYDCPKCKGNKVTQITLSLDGEKQCDFCFGDGYVKVDIEKMIPVTSSVLRAVGYDDVRAVLALEFAGGTYFYWYVSPYAYKELLRASSKGTYFNKNIRGKHIEMKVS